MPGGACVESDTNQQTIGSLVTNNYHPIYRRKDGTTWMKLNEINVVPAKKQDDYWVGDGEVEYFDPNEIVEVLHEASEMVA